MSVVTDRCAAAVLACALLAVLASCYVSPAPPGWSAKPEDAHRDAFGSWIRVHATAAAAPIAEGELVAIDGDSLHVLTEQRFESFSRDSVCCVELVAYRMDISQLQLWGLLGTLSTASHGFVLLLTAPIWAIASTAAVAAASNAPRIRSTDATILRLYARFPQGLPPGVDRTALVMKARPPAPPRRRH